MMENVLSIWRNHFVNEEHMLMVSSSMLVPERVLEASGHKELFADFMVKDKVRAWPRHTVAVFGVSPARFACLPGKR